MYKGVYLFAATKDNTTNLFELRVETSKICFVQLDAKCLNSYSVLGVCRNYLQNNGFIYLNEEGVLYNYSESKIIENH